MIESTELYKEAMVADTRRIEFKAVMDMTDPDLVVGSVVSSQQAAYSNTDQLSDKISSTTPYITLEYNHWVLDGEGQLIDELSEDAEFGWVGEEMCGADGVFAKPQVLTVDFSGVDILQTAQVYFSDREVDGVAADFTIEILSAGVAYHTQEYTNNGESQVKMTDFTVYNPDQIRVTIKRWSTPNRRARVSEFLFGDYEEWTGGELAGIVIKMQGDVSNVSLPYGTCSITLDNQDRRFEPRRKNSLFKSIQERQGIDVQLGVKTTAGTEFKRLGVFYQFAEGWKTSDNGMLINWDLVDIVGLIANRQFIPPSPLPTTLLGWVQAVAGQLGENFVNRVKVDENYASTPVSVRNANDVADITCGDVFRYACMAAGCWGRADASTGYLCAEPLWSEGNKITLDNLVNYPTMKANNDLAAIIFTINDGTNSGNGSQYVVSGNSTAAATTIAISNPFIKTQAQALTASRLILECYGGNQIEITGRGDMASEIGDVDTVWIDDSQATTARRIEQTFDFSKGVLVNCPSRLLQADGAFLFQNREIITTDGTWTAPDGVSQIRMIVVGGGKSGATGGDGGWNGAGANGADGAGGKVFSTTININNRQNFAVTIGKGGKNPTDTIFGAYSSADGSEFQYGYTDIANGDSFARTGVKKPLPNSGDGGKGGRGGSGGASHTATDPNSGREYTVVDKYPSDGEAGAVGASGCVVVYYNK